MANLLVVDDEVILLSVIEVVLTSAGHNVTCAKDGKSALNELIRNPNFDLVISDIMMPNMSGIELYEQAHTERPTDCPPFLFISAQDFSHIRRTVTGMEFVGFVAKPFKAEELIQSVDHAIRAKVL